MIRNDAMVLRPLRPADASSRYLRWLQDTEVIRFLEVRFSPPRSVPELESFIARALADEDILLLGIFIEAGNKHIGNIKLGPINRRHRVAEIGFLIGDQEEWGKGYASQAIALVCDYAFLELGLAKVTAGCYEMNEGSRRALLKAGFREEGRLASHWELDGDRQDGLLFGKVNPKTKVVEDGTI